MVSQLTLLALAASALALQITSPGKNDLWDLSKPNTIVWNAVNTDVQTFDIYLSHMASHPPTNTLLVANANKDAGSFVVKDLQLPIGTTYQINFVAHDKPEQIYAQSQQFNTTGEAIAATSTLDGYTGPTYTPSASGGAAQTGASTSSLPTGSVTRTTLRTLTTTSSGSVVLQTTSATTTEDAAASVTRSVASAASASASASTTRAASSASGNGASAPLAALVFGIAAFFL